MPTAKKKKKAVNVIFTCAADAEKCPAIPGNAGRYKSVESGINMFVTVIKAINPFNPK